MKTAYKVLVAIVVLVCVVFGTLSFMDKYYTTKIQGRYYDIMNPELMYQKNKGLELQKKALERNDIINVYGSSELASNSEIIKNHPSNFLQKHDAGFQMNLIGIGYCQSIIHAINFAALGEYMKEKKVAVIISPQWFTKEGLAPQQFNMNFSDYQFYTLLSSSTLDTSIKEYIAQRVSQLTEKDSSYPSAHFYAYLYSKDNLISKALLAITMPYYKFDQYLLTIKDKIKAYQRLEQFKSKEFKKGSKNKINWKQEAEKAYQEGKREANNNSFYIMNNYYNTYIKGKENTLKDSSKGKSYSDSPEYGDLKILLDVCKRYKIKPLFINVPVNGKWYDFTGFSKKERDVYYDKLKKLISSYGYDIADLSDREYDPYFLQDVMHLGWKGWLDVDQAIYEYYHRD